MVTGHFQLPQFIADIPNQRFVVGKDATSLWMTQNPAIYRKALAGLTMEHLGCKMWADNANGKYVQTGHYEWGPTYTTPKRGMTDKTNMQAYLAAVQATNAIPAPPPIRSSQCCGARSPSSSARARRSMPAELGTVSLCPLPPTCAGGSWSSAGPVEPRKARQAADLRADPELRRDDQRVGRSAGNRLLSERWRARAASTSTSRSRWIRRRTGHR